MKHLYRFRLLIVGLALIFAGCDNDPTVVRTAAPPSFTPVPQVARLGLMYPLRNDWLVRGIPTATPTKSNYLNSVAPLMYWTPGQPPTDTDQVALQNDMTGAGLERKIFHTSILNADARLQLSRALNKYFGSPDQPKVAPASGEDARAITDLKLDPLTLARGAVVFRANCTTCHGPYGAGNGESARAMVPSPRDYREGMFKFISTDTLVIDNELGNPPYKTFFKYKPRRADLYKTIRQGLNGSGMTSFAGLSESEIEAVISYVIHLSLRGEAEYLVLTLIDAAVKNPNEQFLNDAFDALFEGNEQPTIETAVAKALRISLKAWSLADRSPIVVEPNPGKTYAERLESAARGLQMVGQCNACHQNYGLKSQMKFDAWGSVVLPRNFTLGVYRGGSEPEDIYRRLYTGILPSGMNSFRDALIDPQTKQRKPGPNALWDLANMVKGLGDPQMRADLAAKHGLVIEQ